MNAGMARIAGAATLDSRRISLAAEFVTTTAGRLHDLRGSEFDSDASQSLRRGCKKLATIALALLLVWPGSGCGNSPASQGTVQGVSQANVYVTISPSSWGLKPGASFTFTGVAVGGTDTTVTWSIREGSIGGAITDAGVYTAPTVDGAYHIIATSREQPAKSATAAVAVGATAVTALPPVPTAPFHITQPSIYVTQYDWSPWSVMVFSRTASGWAGPPVEIPGSQVSVDAAGNVYVVVINNDALAMATRIDVYSPDSPTGKPVRSLPIGPGTKIADVERMVASATGEIYVSDGKGIAVFSSTATGNADPVRYILGNTQPGGGPSTAVVPGFPIAVDGSDNLYVLNTLDHSIAVFGPTDTGTVVPSRTIGGPLTQLPGGPGSYNVGVGPYYTDMAADSLGNLYVLCYCGKATGLNPFGVVEFGPTANGNVAPLRYVTTPGLDTEYEGTGVAVDSAGTIYVMASRVLSEGAVFEFSATDSGSVTPSKVLTYSNWWESTGTMAVH